MLERFAGQTALDWPYLAAALLLSAIIAYIIADVAARLARVAFVSALPAEAGGLVGPNARRPIRIVRGTVFVTALLALMGPALRLAGANPGVGLTPGVLSGWFFTSGLRILVVGLLAYVQLRLIAGVARRLEDEIARETGIDAMERLKRARTMSRLLQNTLSVAVVVIASLIILRELRVDILPILTGAGIVGLAVGFGAQTLVRDVISGFFLILENQVRVGDAVDINGRGGLVEAINLRTIVIRDFEGVVHIFPNGAIETLANRTKDYSYCVVDLRVDYSEDPDRVVEALRAVGADLARDTTWQADVLAPIETYSVDTFTETAVLIKARMKTVPLKQADVGRELRRRIKKAFDAERIEMAQRQISVVLDQTGGPLMLKQVG
jgi:small conductance mechanosensitive channel